MDNKESEEDGVEREEVESRLFGNFPEGYLVEMGARPVSGGRPP